MSKQNLLVNKSDLGATRLTSEPLPDALVEGQVLVEVEQFGLTTNNITYAVFGDALAYWSYFPAEEGWGNVPVWGFGKVASSKNADIVVGERLFGYLPMSSHLTLTPSATTPLCFSDASAHRTALHPWYNRYYRCAADPLYSDDNASVQPILWALFMTGWMLAEQVADTVDTVYVTSASSKTALSFAWSMQHLSAKAKVIGITSPGNRAFVEKLGQYAEIQTYDDLHASPETKTAAFVDIAGNAVVRSAAHVMLGDRLSNSITIGATHRSAPDEALPMPGPEPQLFFIPSVAEERAAQEGFETTHQRFATAWGAFAPWAAQWLELDKGTGAAAIDAGYMKAFAGNMPPEQAMVFSW